MQNGMEEMKPRATGEKYVNNRNIKIRNRNKKAKLDKDEAIQAILRHSPERIVWVLIAAVVIVVVVK